MKHIITYRLMIIAIAYLIGSQASLVNGQMIYVDCNASGAGSGANWTDAYTNLSASLASAGDGSSIWVAKGTYLPGTNNATDRTNTFLLKNGVGLFGGFTNGMALFSERDWLSYTTTLSGNIGVSGSYADNCYHVVTVESGAGYSTVLDGFTITLGYNIDTVVGTETNNGAGLYAKNCSPSISNCVFSYNKAGIGGGIYFSNSSSRVDKCTFFTNCAVKTTYGSGNGGGIYTYPGATEVINCNFISNYASCGGGFYHVDGYLGRSPVISNCLFTKNYGGSAAGGGYLNIRNTSVNVLDSRFVDNYGYDGAGLQLASCTTSTVANCVFVDNRTRMNGTRGGGVYVYNCISTVLSNCISVGNKTSYGGGVVFRGTKIGSLPTLAVDCIFAGNNSDNFWAGIAITESSGIVTVKNCLVVGNYNTGALPGGAGIVNGAGCTSVFENCTIASNYSTTVGGGALNTNGSLTIKNSILWGNNSSAGGGTELYVAGALGTGTVSYTDVKGGISGSGVVTANGGTVSNAGGNIDGNPLFVGGPTGQWTAASTYNNSTGQSTLTNSAASWTTNAFAGLMINPDTTQCLQLYIVTNTVTTITVWGNATAVAHSSDRYQIMDYHEKAGSAEHWTSSGYVPDNGVSPCIDAGDPSSDYTLEPEPNGKHINMGAYGNTLQASKTLFKGTLFTVY